MRNQTRWQLPHMVFIAMVMAVMVTNAEPLRVTLDGNPATRDIAPVTTAVIPGERFMVAVFAQNVERMHSYSVKCSFDDEVVSFEGASATLSPLAPAFLESAGGKIAAFLAIPGSDTVEVAATQTGKGVTTSVDGSGILGYLSFKATNSGNPEITLIEARIVDPEGSATVANVKR